MNRPDIPPGPRRPLRRQVVQQAASDEPASGGSPRTAAVPLIGGGAGLPIPDGPQEALPSPAAEAALRAVSVWMPDDLRSRIDEAMPGVHRRSMVAVAYSRHHHRMYAEPVHRPGVVRGCRSRNWTVRLSHGEYGDLLALARHLEWPVSALIRKLLELDVGLEEGRRPPPAG